MAYAARQGSISQLTQYHLAATLGLSPVHINRVLTQTREHGIMTFRDGKVNSHNYIVVKPAELDPAHLDQTGPLLKMNGPPP